MPLQNKHHEKQLELPNVLREPKFILHYRVFIYGKIDTKTPINLIKTWKSFIFTCHACTYMNRYFPIYPNALKGPNYCNYFKGLYEDEIKQGKMVLKEPNFMLEWQLFHHCGWDKRWSQYSCISKIWEERRWRSWEFSSDYWRMEESPWKLDVLIHSVDQRGVIRNNGDFEYTLDIYLHHCQLL